MTKTFLSASHVLLVVLNLSQLCLGVPPVREDDSRDFKEVKRVQDLRGADGYNLQYLADDGSVRVEKGGFVNGVWVVRGSVTSFRPDGRMHTLYYLADDKGYRTTETLSEGHRNQLPDFLHYGVSNDYESDIESTRIGKGALQSLVG